MLRSLLSCYQAHPSTQKKYCVRCEPRSIHFLSANEVVFRRFRLQAKRSRRRQWQTPLPWLKEASNICLLNWGNRVILEISTLLSHLAETGLADSMAGATHTL